MWSKIFIETEDPSEGSNLRDTVSPEIDVIQVDIINDGIDMFFKEDPLTPGLNFEKNDFRVEISKTEAIFMAKSILLAYQMWEQQEKELENELF